MKKSFFVFFKIFVTTSIFFILITHIDIDNFFNVIKKIELKFYFYALVIALVQLLLNVTRWKIIINHLGDKIDHLILTKIFWIGLFFNQVLPTSVGGDVVKSYYLFKENVKFDRVVLSIVIDRVFGMVGLSFLSMLVVIFFHGRAGASPILIEVITLWFVFYFSIGVFFMFDKIFFPFANIKIIKWLNSIAYDLRKIIFSINPSIKLLIISLFIHSLNILIFLVLAKGSGIFYLWESFVFIVPLATLIMSIPISIAGWGIREGVLVAGLSYTGVQNEVTLAISVMFGLIVLLHSLPGAVLWLINKKKN